MFMKVPAFLIPVLVVTALLFCAGCTQAPSARTPDLQGGVVDLRNLSLTPADLPSCFSLTGGRAKDAGDVGSRAKDLGWQAGYVVTYSCSEGEAGPDIITHTLAVYPEGNIPGIVSMVDVQDRPSGFSFENLSFPHKGAVFYGFYGNASRKPDSADSTGSFFSGNGRGGTAGNESGSDFAEIIFYRGTVFEVIRMSGPRINTTLLEELAVKAYERAG